MFLSSRQQRLDSWKQTRAKGKARFVADMSLRRAVPLILGLSLLNYFLNGSFRRTLIMLIGFLVITPFAALVEWWKNEGTYRSAKLDERFGAANNDLTDHRGET